MQRLHFGWLFFAPVLLNVGACGGDSKSNATPRASGGAEPTAGTASAGGKSGALAGAAAMLAGENSGGGELGGAGGQGSGDAGAPDAGGSASGGSANGGAAGGTEHDCDEPVPLSILGDYGEAGGTELWLRNSGRAVTLTRLAVGNPVAAKPPDLWQVVQACPGESALLLKGVTGAFTRLDYLRGNASLTVCWSSATAATPELASELLPADRTNTIDAGCNGGPWTRFTKGGR